MQHELAETIYCSISSAKRVEWVELLSNNPNIPIPFLENLLQSYRYTHPAALSEVLLGLKNGLSVEDVSIYGNSSFTENQMKEIRLGLESLKNRDLVKLYADDRYSDLKMKVVRKLLEAGFDIEKVKVYLDTPEYSFKRLEQVELGIIHSLTLKQLQYYSKSEYNEEQMIILRESFESGLGFDELHLLAKSHFEPDQMKTIRDAILIDKLPLDSVVLASRICFDVMQMKEILDGIKLGLSNDQIRLFANPSYSVHHMRIIKKFLTLYPKEKELQALILENNISYQRLLMVETSYNNGYDKETLKFILESKNIEESKMWKLLYAVECGISISDVQKIAKYSEKYLQVIIEGLKAGITTEDIDEADSNNLIIEDYISAEIAKKLRTLLYNY